MTSYDVIIIGAGAMGSAAAYHLSKRNLRVLLLEQFEIDHKNGSSYGNSRIIRYTYKDPEYIQLAKEVYPLWRELEAEAGKTLWHVTGGLDFGVPGEPSLEDTIQYVIDAGIPYEMLSPEETHRRFPQFTIPDNYKVMYQAEAGMLSASEVVIEQVRLSQAHGADLRTNAPVTSISATPSGVTVTANGETYSGSKLILTAGGWTNEALAILSDGYQLPLQPLRCQEQHFEVGPDYVMADYSVGAMPLYIFHKNMDDGEAIYGIPSYNGAGVKASVYGGVNVDHPRHVDHAPDTAMIEHVQRHTQVFLPAVGTGKIKEARACLYTMTPDHHFIIDHHPHFENVVIGAGFSGHGFKFSHGVGKILGELATDGESPHDLSLWRINRFENAPSGD
jgi:monomeric sarcosine oxidase